jgi:hypothetical protein
LILFFPPCCCQPAMRCTAHPGSAVGHFRQIDPLPTLSASPLRSDRVRTFAPQRIDAVCVSSSGGKFVTRRFQTFATKSATSGLMQRSKRRCYSITSSARASSIGGTSRPSALAVLRLMTRSNLVGCSTGISPGFAPRRILSTKSAARRYRSGIFGP